MKNMSLEAIRDRISYIKSVSRSNPKLAREEADDLQEDFLRLVITEEPTKDLAAKAKLILNASLKV